MLTISRSERDLLREEGVALLDAYVPMGATPPVELAAGHEMNLR
jgi:hypothetical protein